MNDTKPVVDDLKAQGLALIRQNRLDEARDLLIRLCGERPEDADAWYLLSSIYGMLGLIDEAGECCGRVIALQPYHSEAHINLGNVLLHQGRPVEAVAEYRAALRINPDNAGALCSLGNALSSLGRLDEAVQSYEAAIRLNPDLFEPHYNLGNLFLEEKRYDEATEHLQRAVRLNPDYAPAYINLGNTFKDRYLIEQAITQYQQAIKIRPDDAKGYRNLGIALKERGDIEQAIRCINHALTIEPAHEDAGNILLMFMHYSDDYSPQELYAAAKDWAARFIPREVDQPPPSNHPDPQRRLRIGYVSGDFHNHPVGYFVQSVLVCHDKARYETFCYYNGNRNDKVTEGLKISADHWRNIRDQSDEAVTEQIRRDGIDILVDLSGHTADHRLMVFARKPAPVQATWLGYFDTTGMDTIDYIIADRYLIPRGDERFYTEQVVRLPNAYLCFPPPDLDLQPNPLPALDSGAVTFGCFNNNAKITEKVVACWSKLLHALPQARLYLKYKPFKDTAVRRRYTDMFARYGIAADRLRFAAHSPRDEYLAVYHEVDIALDPFPFNGCMTTMWALWMGVPVVTLRGDRYVARMGETILSDIDLPECVADSPDDYIAKAAALAGDLPRLAALRRGLRERLLNAPLCDGQGFTRDLEQAYRNMWEIWCRQQTGILEESR